MLEADIRAVVIKIQFGDTPTDAEKIKVFWNNQNVERPEICKEPTANDFYINLDITSITSLGEPCKDITGVSPNELQNWMQLYTVSVDVEATGFDAQNRVQNISDCFSKNSIQDHLLTTGIRLLNIPGITDTSFEENEKWTERFNLDIIFSYRSTVSESTSIIETVNFSVT